MSTRLRFGLCLVLLTACGLPGIGLAGIRDSTFVVDSNGAKIAFEIREVARREVLRRLFADAATEIEWLGKSFADEPISGSFAGSRESVLRRLLTDTNFLISYAGSPDKPRISRIVVIGKSVPRIAAPASRPEQASALKPPLAGVLAALKPPPAGASPPVLVPPSPGDAAIPLIVPAAGATAPPMRLPSWVETSPLLQAPGAPAKR